MNDEGGGEGLASFAVGRVAFSGLLNNNGVVEVFLSLKSLTLTDIRPNSDLAVKQYVILVVLRGGSSYLRSQQGL